MSSDEIIVQVRPPEEVIVQVVPPAETIVQVTGGGGGGGGGTFDPAADQTITGQWTFESTVAPVAASLLIPELGLVITADTPGSAGNLIIVFAQVNFHSETTGDMPLRVWTAESQFGGVDGSYVSPPVSGVFINLPTTDDGLTVVDVTSAEVMAAVNTAAVGVTATLAPGNDGSELSTGVGYAQLAGGVDRTEVVLTDGQISSPVRIQPIELNQTPLTLKAAEGSTIGTAIVNVEYADGTPNNPSGYGVAHIDSDGGGGFSGDRLAFSEDGQVRINVDSALSAKTALSVRDQDVEFFSLQAGFNYVFAVNARTAEQTIAAFSPYPGATGDAIVVIDGDDGMTKRFRVTPTGDVYTSAVVLKSPDGTDWRVTVADDGTLSTTAV